MAAEDHAPEERTLFIYLYYITLGRLCLHPRIEDHGALRPGELGSSVLGLRERGFPAWRARRRTPPRGPSPRVVSPSLPRLASRYPPGPASRPPAGMRSLSQPPVRYRRELRCVVSKALILGCSLLSCVVRAWLAGLAPRYSLGPTSQYRVASTKSANLPGSLRASFQSAERLWELGRCLGHPPPPFLFPLFPSHGHSFHLSTAFLQCAACPGVAS